MKVKNKILLTVIPVIILFAMLMNIVFGIFFQNFVILQEENQIKTATDSLSTYISERLVNGQGNVKDWGNWDDTYYFIENENPDYISGNLTDTTFNNLDLNFIIIVNADNDIVYQQYFSLEENEFSEFPVKFNIKDNQILFSKLQPFTSSIMKIGDIYYFVSSTDVTDSAMTLPANGILIMGRECDSSIIEKVETITGWEYSSVNNLENFESIADGSVISTLSKTYSPSRDLIYISLAIPNEYRIQDSIQIDFEISRALYISAMKSAFGFGVFNTVLSIIIAIIIVMVLTNSLTKPFDSLVHEVSSIDTSKDKYTKLSEKGNREFVYLQKSINNLLFKIEDNQARISNLALYDQLTGIPNRSLFNDILKRDISLSSRTGKILGVVFLDLDDFKSVNDTLGHEMGDELLKQVSNRLSSSIRKHDTVARFGGDEFLLILNNMIDINDLQNKVGNIMEIFNEPFILDSLEYFVTCSVGVSVYPVDGEDYETLVKNADIAMYNSKNSGKNAKTFSTLLMKEDLNERIELTNYLYRAQERDELEVYYQPQINVTNEKIIGFEALLRWNHPTKGLLLPGKFINLAEQTRLINPIGQWVIETVCKQIKRWDDMGFSAIRIAVNVSLIQFLEPDFVNMVKNIIIESGINPQSLEIELTESVATKNALNIEPILVNLKAIGVSIAIDDFGTEYSSLTRLKNLSIDRIKMDMQFVHSISKSDKDDAIARIIIQLARNLNLNIIAEGIETENQLNFLSMNACDEVQGYYYYRPMKAAEAEKLLLEQNLQTNKTE